MMVKEGKGQSFPLHAFRRRYPDGANFVVASDVGEPYPREYGGLLVTFIPLEEIGSILNPS